MSLRLGGWATDTQLVSRKALAATLARHFRDEFIKEAHKVPLSRSNCPEAYSNVRPERSDLRSKAVRVHPQSLGLGCKPHASCLCDVKGDERQICSVVPLPGLQKREAARLAEARGCQACRSARLPGVPCKLWSALLAQLSWHRQWSS